MVVIFKMTERELAVKIKEKALGNLYFFYGEESWLSEHYTKQIEKIVCDGDSFGEYNKAAIHGDSATPSDILNATETLPLMSDKKFISVRDLDVSKCDFDEILAIISDVPDYCVLVFWQEYVAVSAKNAKWKKFISAVEKTGEIVKFEHKTTAELKRILISGAKKRGAELAPNLAGFMLERCGNRLIHLTNELDKVCAGAIGDNGGVIERRHIEQLTTESLEASVFALSKAILQRQSDTAFGILHSLFYNREEPIAVAAVLASAFADLYRAKVAENAGEPALAVGDSYNYRGKDFRLKNAARDVRKIDMRSIKKSLQILCKLDETLKSTNLDKTIVVENAVAQLMLAV